MLFCRSGRAHLASTRLKIHLKCMKNDEIGRFMIETSWILSPGVTSEHGLELQGPQVKSGFLRRRGVPEYEVSKAIPQLGRSSRASF